MKRIRLLILAAVTAAGLAACNPYATYVPTSTHSDAPAADTYSTCAEQPTAVGNEFCAALP